MLLHRGTEYGTHKTDTGLAQATARAILHPHSEVSPSERFVSFSDARSRYDTAAEHTLQAAFRQTKLEETVF